MLTRLGSTILKYVFFMAVHLYLRIFFVALYTLDKKIFTSASLVYHICQLNAMFLAWKKLQRLQNSIDIVFRNQDFFTLTQLNLTVPNIARSTIYKILQNNRNS